MKIEDFKNDFDVIFLQELSFFIEKAEKNLKSENIISNIKMDNDVESEKIKS